MLAGDTRQYPTRYSNAPMLEGVRIKGRLLACNLLCSQKNASSKRLPRFYLMGSWLMYYVVHVRGSTFPPGTSLLAFLEFLSVLKRV